MLRDERDSNAPFAKVGKRLRENVDSIKEYDIVMPDGEHFRGFAPTFFNISDHEYHAAQQLKLKLLKQYEGKILEEALVGEEVVTKSGTCYRIKSQHTVSLKTVTPDGARGKILGSLTLLYGIGEATERVLKDHGYKTIEDLTEHPRFGSEATTFLDLLNGCDTRRIANWICKWFPKSHPLVLSVSGLHKKEDFLFVDIETLGLFTRPIILFGVAHFSDNTLLIHQYLLRSIQEEPAALTAMLSHLKSGSAFITFNGRTFDIPYIKERLAYYRMGGDLERPHFDVLHFSRRAWKGIADNFKLTTLERQFIGTRKDDVPSALVPEFYETYVRTNNIGPLISVVDHNKQDLIALTFLFSRLCEEFA
jgi:uncharacterized protein YprB with RNaseH-like and TPR domain